MRVLRAPNCQPTGGFIHGYGIEALPVGAKFFALQSSFWVLGYGNCNVLALRLRLY
jgi:hypothetical protein